MGDRPNTERRAEALCPQPTSGQVTIAEGGNLFKVAPELRQMIYEYYFTGERQETSPGSLWEGESRSTLLLKVPLLRTNKFVRADALPAFYKCHIFRIRHPPYSRPETQLSRMMTAGIQPIRNVELLTAGHDIEDIVSQQPIAPYLQGFLDSFPELRFLALHFCCKSSSGHWEGDGPPRHGTDSPAIYGLLAQLLERLDHLKIVLYHRKDDDGKGLHSLERIAPRSRWIEESTGDAAGINKGSSRTVWSLRCSEIPSAPANAANEMEIQTGDP